MIKTILSPFKNYAWFKRLNAKVSYELLAKYIPAEEWQFMNYGYVTQSHEQPLTLAAEPSQRYPLQMYHYLAVKADLKGKDVLEVGSGRGGGARYIASTLEPGSYTGVDLASNAVALANRLHPLPNLKFVQGNAEHLPFEANSFDVVINVESCHAYGNVAQFLAEVKRVLKPGGVFLMVDFRYAIQMDLLTQQLNECGLKMVSTENISKNVVEAIDAENDVKVARIKKLFPPKWQALFSEFAGVSGSKFHRTLQSGERVYMRYVLQKV